jgi:hypothetical protein
MATALKRLATRVGLAIPGGRQQALWSGLLTYDSNTSENPTSGDITMSNLLHPHFLESITNYRECERYWQIVLNDVFLESCTLGQWHRWIADFKPGGTPFALREFELDGSAIINGRSYATNRAFRVNQYAPCDILWLIDARVSDYSSGYASTWPASELVIDLVLSEETVEIAKRLLGKWMWPETSHEDMRRLIANLIPEEGPPPK